MKVRNKSGNSRTIAATGDTVPDGETVTVAKGLGTSLCEQSDVWEQATKTTKNDSEDS